MSPEVCHAVVGADMQSTGFLQGCRVEGSSIAVRSLRSCGLGDVLPCGSSHLALGHPLLMVGVGATLNASPTDLDTLEGKGMSYRIQAFFGLHSNISWFPPLLAFPFGVEIR